MIPFLDLSYTNEAFYKKAGKALQEVVKSGKYILGPQTAAFEELMASYCGFKHALGISSGTDALLAALMALDIQPGDKVLVPNFTFIASANVVMRLGAKPVLVDIEDANSQYPYQMCPRSLERLIMYEDPKPKAIIMVALYGYLPDVKTIRGVAQRHDIPIIEDLAQALGTKIPDTEDRLACLSFYPTKNLGAFGDAGMILTNDDEMHEKLLAIRNHGQTERYHATILGGNFRINEMQAAVLRVKMAGLDQHLMERQDVANEYYRAFHSRDSDLHIWQVMSIPRLDINYSYNQYVVRFKTKTLRDLVINRFQRHKIGYNLYYPLTLDQQALFKDCLCENTISHRVAESCLALPIYPGLSKDKIKTIVKTIIVEVELAIQIQSCRDA